MARSLKEGQMSEGKMSYSKDKENPAVIIAKAQAKADHWHDTALKLSSVLFDVLYPKYKSDDMEFKQKFIYYQEEHKKLIAERDSAKHRAKALQAENSRLRQAVSALQSLIGSTPKEEDND